LPRPGLLHGDGSGRRRARGHVRTHRHPTPIPSHPGGSRRPSAGGRDRSRRRTHPRPRTGGTRTIMKQLIATTAIAAVTLSACGFVNTGEESAGENDATLTAYVSTEQNVGLEPLYERFRKETGITVDASHALVDELNQQLRIQLTS